MTTVYLNGVGIAAPGLCGWDETRAVLRGTIPYNAEKIPDIKSDAIPPRERRRASATANLAVHVAEQAVQNAEVNPADLATIFASFLGDLQIADKLCSSLTLPGRPVSPFQFHNSVHNAPAAYWSIATKSKKPSTSIACASKTFHAALLDAITFIKTEHQDVLLTVYDIATNDDLAKYHPIKNDFGVALVLQVKKTKSSLAELKINFISKEIKESNNEINPLTSLIKSNTSAQALILLSAVAMMKQQTIHLNYLSNCSIEIEVIPCL
ncbi:MAG: beta-ketoacyl synthase chain length factor [Nitrospinales bacterium]